MPPKQTTRPVPTFAADALKRAFRSLDPIESLQGVKDLRDLLDQLEPQLVNEMRTTGWSWEAIAEATHLASKQRAHQKFAEPTWATTAAARAPSKQETKRSDGREN